MSIKSRDFLIGQFVFMVLLIATLDCIIRGPLEIVNQQIEHLLWLRQATSCQGIEELHNEVSLLKLKQFEIEERIR